MMAIKTTPRFSIGGRGVCFLIVVLALSCAAMAAQCSQATRPVIAPDRPTSPVQDTPPAIAATASSSSSETAGTVRFVTGGAITVLEDTPLQVITDVPISSRTTKAGARLSFTLTRDVVVDGILVIPCGARVFGTVVAAKQAGRLVGASNLSLELTELNLDGRTYPLYTPPFKVVGESKTRPTTKKIATGATIGAVAANVAAPKVTYTLVDPIGPGKTVTKNLPVEHRARGVAMAAGVGAGVGTAIAASSPPSIALIPAESQIEFTLASPIAVFPIDQRSAARLAQGMHHGGPVLYVRGESQ